ncbi:unnamed protein product [Sympodiomycopsis kandeliae]
MMHDQQHHSRHHHHSNYRQHPHSHHLPVESSAQPGHSISSSSSIGSHPSSSSSSSSSAVRYLYPDSSSPPSASSSSASHHHNHRAQESISSPSSSKSRTDSQGSSTTTSPSSSRLPSQRKLLSGAIITANTRSPSPTPTQSPASSYASSSNGTCNEALSGSASSSLGTSPLTHEEHLQSASSGSSNLHAISSSTSTALSPRTRDLIQAQRELYQRKQAPSITTHLTSPHYQHHHPAPMQVITQQQHPDNTPSDQHSRPHNTPSDVIMTSPTSSASPQQSMIPNSSSSNSGSSNHLPQVSSSSTTSASSSSHTDRGAKSRRASSGGSRIPERGRSYSTHSHGHGQSGPSSASQSQGSSSGNTTTTINGSTYTGSDSIHARRTPPRTFSGSSSSSQTSQREGPSTHRYPVTADSPRPNPASNHLQRTDDDDSGTPVPPVQHQQQQQARRTPSLPHLDLAKYPQQDLLRILAALLHQISSANDSLRPTPAATPSQDGANTPMSTGNNNSNSDGPTAGASLADRRSSVTTAAMGALGTPSSTLCFHARNVPSISIESYLLRILKYCPTTNDVFLSLLVYFDRMSRMGAGVDPRLGSENSMAGADAGLPQAQQRLQGDASRSGSSDMDRDSTLSSSTSSSLSEAHPGMKGFAIDSYNVHRLVIAGVTVASKFFSDVFYTNSRYAKVGGLPVHELNQLELQFLLLNDFHLMISKNEIQRYADQLLAYSQGPNIDSADVESTATTIAGTGTGTGAEHDRSAAAAVRMEE